MKLRNKNTGIVYEPSDEGVEKMMVDSGDFEKVEEPKKEPSRKAQKEE